MGERDFKLWFTIVPLILTIFVPSAVFGLALGQWGSNVLWGSLFGAGWCVASFSTGSQWGIAAFAGLLVWPTLVSIGLYIVSGQIWRAKSGKLRRGALWLLAGTSFLMLPANVMMDLDKSIHLPELVLHIATSY